MIKFTENVTDSYSQFIQDLKFVLVGYLSPIYDKISVVNETENLVIQELFSEHGALPVFVYDKNIAVASYLTAFNHRYNTNYVGEFVLVVDPGSWTNITVTFSHNIDMKTVNSPDDVAYIAYHGLKNFVAKTILSQKELELKENFEINIDQLVNKYLEQVNKYYEQHYTKNEYKNLKTEHSISEFTEDVQNYLELLDTVGEPISLEELDDFYLTVSSQATKEAQKEDKLTACVKKDKHKKK